MDIHNLVSTEKLAKQIQSCVKDHFTGRLEVKNTQFLQFWSLYFYQGSLIWAASSVHSIRRFHRQMSLHCPELPINTVVESGSDTVDWEYKFLAKLVKQGKIQWEQMAAVIEGQITEILVDLLQQSELESRSIMPLTYRRIPKSTIDSTTKDSTRLVLIATVHPWLQAKHAWEAWRQAGLKDYSPNLAPVIRQAKELRQQIPAVAYHKLILLADGNWTLRDLAVKLKKNLLLLTQSIIPYIDQGSIRLIEVDDITQSFQPKLSTTNVSHRGEIGRWKDSQKDAESEKKSLSPLHPLPAPTTPLIACIDDSKNDSLIMNHILTEAGYQCINIQDPVKALLILLKRKPELIFLDLIMPVVNGYEICSQIRRTSVFKDIPVIILTNNDGIVDRVRAKVVGASGFLAKPIKVEKVLKIIGKHLPTTKPVQSQRLQMQTLRPKQMNLNSQSCLTKVL
jgi:CheY-like chemotaxis protein